MPLSFFFANCVISMFSKLTLKKRILRANKSGVPVGVSTRS